MGGGGGVHYVGENWRQNEGPQARVVWQCDEAGRGPGQGYLGFLEFEDRRGKSKPKLTWEQVKRVDMIAYGIDRTLAEDRRAWKTGY